MKKEELVLHPKIGVGPFRLNDPLSDAGEEADFRKVELGNGHTEYWYRSDSLGLSVYDDEPDEPGIDSIHCSRFLYFKGQNMIGMHIKALAEHLDAMPDLGSTDFMELTEYERQFVFEFDTLGLQVWVNEDDKLVDTIIVGRIFDEDD